MALAGEVELVLLDAEELGLGHGHLQNGHLLSEASWWKVVWLLGGILGGLKLGCGW